MLTDDEIAFLRAQLDEDEAIAKRAAECALVQHDGCEPGDWSWLRRYGQPQPAQIALIDHQARFDPARVLREVAVWRRLLLDYPIPPGTDAAYGGTERETGFRLALSAALKAKIATYDGNPVTGEPYPSGANERPAP